MTISYELLFGSKENDVDKLARYLDSKFGLDFLKRDSSYLGEYYLYKGLHADRVELKHNFNSVEQAYTLPNSNDIKTILNCIIDTGKKFDRSQRFNI